MNNIDVEANKNIAIIQELEISTKLVKKGLHEFQNISFINDFYFLPILLISNGLERFIKIIICLHHFEKNKKYPNLSTIRNYGHNLTRLFDYVFNAFFQSVDDKPTAVAEDLKFLRSKFSKTIITNLSEFGISARYHYLDEILGENPKTKPPETIWHMLEMEIIATEDVNWLKNINSQKYRDKYFVRVRENFVVPIERIMRILSRIFTFGYLGENARTFIPSLDPFYSLRDEDLGKTKY